MLREGELPYLWNLAVRYVAIDEVAARYRMSLDYRLTPRLSVGIERAGADQGDQQAGEFGLGWLARSDGDALLMPRASWFITPEAGLWPSAVLGVGSDRLSIPRGQGYFLTFAKNVPETPFSPFVSLKYGTDKERLAFPFGINVRLDSIHTFQAINDGEYTHLLLTRIGDPVSVSFMLARSEYPGIAISFGF